MSSPADSRPRILHVVTRFAAGGSEQRVRDMVAAVPWAHHHLLVGELVEADHVLLPVPREDIEIEPALQRSIDPRRDMAALLRVAKHIRGRGYVLVVTHQSKAGALGRMAARRARVPVVQSLSMASFGPGYGRLSSTVFHAVERFLVSRTAAYAVVGRDLARQYEALGGDPGQFHVVRSGAQIPDPPANRVLARAELARLAGYAEGRAAVAYVGSLEERKNPLLLVDLLRQARKLAPERDVVLVIAGDGPQRGELEALIAARGLTDHVRLLGHVGNPAIVFQGADVIVLLSNAEGLPQVLVQAAATGVPFVAFEVSGVRELIELGAAGRAVPLGDVQGAATAAAELLALGDSATGRRVDLHEWTPEVIRARYEALFAPLLPAGPQTPRR